MKPRDIDPRLQVSEASEKAPEADKAEMALLDYWVVGRAEGEPNWPELASLAKTLGEGLETFHLQLSVPGRGALLRQMRMVFIEDINAVLKLQIQNPERRKASFEAAIALLYDSDPMILVKYKDHLTKSFKRVTENSEIDEEDANRANAALEILAQKLIRMQTSSVGEGVVSEIEKHPAAA